MKKEQFISIQMEGSLSIPGILFLNYPKLGLSEPEMMLIFQVQLFIQQGKLFPTPDELAARMSASSPDCSMMLRSLIQRGFLKIEDEDIQSVRFEKYSLEPLWDKLYRFLTEAKIEQCEPEKTEESLYSVFEQEFGRPLSPFECETLGIWMDQDHHDHDIIKAALRESVISGKLNFRYIDRILFEWKRNGIKTIQQAKDHSRQFRQGQGKGRQSEQQTDEPYQRKVPFYNWLEN
ncbi:DnaD domain-containing protein [Bacillus sp. SJS]|uniref:DnaD domain-containing protein n=1 Tax=Bacillus sp. SJS TaxID=1423321 RepID=UPI0004DD0446|nr:DnaD domain-containing protein [Bacillus sp. SJS]KZZ86379.1 DNA replication protein DnaD [Bacillus sp. SJS]